MPGYISVSDSLFMEPLTVLFLYHNAFSKMSSDFTPLSIEMGLEFGFTYYFGNGDYYQGIGYQFPGTAPLYSAGDRLEGPSNDTLNTGYYIIEYVSSVEIHPAYNDYVSVHTYFDSETDIDGFGTGGYGSAIYVQADDSFGGLGSETGTAYNADRDETSDNFFSNTNSVDLNFFGDQSFGFTYYYGDGDYYSGSGYAPAGTYTIGERISFFSNDTGNDGYYNIDWVSNLGYETSRVNHIMIDSYFDSATDFDGYGDGGYGFASYFFGDGYSGLGSEHGEAYDESRTLTGDNYFSNDDSADISLLVDQEFGFTYHYGNGDYYSGFGYAPAGSYVPGQLPDFYDNDATGSGYYVIDYVNDLGFASPLRNNIIITSYYDASTDRDGIAVGGYGYAVPSWGVGYAGLGSERGEVYDSVSYVWSGDNAFDHYNSADLFLGTTLSVTSSSASKRESDSGSRKFTFIVTRVGDLSHSSSARWSVNQSGSDTADADDFLVGRFRSGIVRFDLGVASREISIRISGDTLQESDEQFTISLFDPTGASLDPHASEAIGLIVNDDVVTLPTISLIATAADKLEGQSGSQKFTFTAFRSGDLSQSSSVQWSFIGSGNHPADGDDFLTGGFRSGVVRFDPGQASCDISVRVLGDRQQEADEQFTLSLHAPNSASIDPLAAEAIGIIRNDDLLNGSFLAARHPLAFPTLVAMEPTI
jgi:hypothetical protein